MNPGGIEAARSKIVRFAVFGAAGFGVGAAIFGDHSTLSDFTMGAMGGAALGIALKDWRITIALALAGLVGFGVGLTVGFIIFFISAPNFGLLQVGLVGGAIGGMALGSTFRSWKSVGILALAGAFGFGIGGLIFDTFSQPMVEPGASGVTFWWAILFMALQGAVGGASLGAALGYLQTRNPTEERRPRVR